MESVSVSPAALKLTYKILGHESEDLLNILKQLASEIGVNHIAYVRMAPNKSLDSNLVAAVVTYPKEWQYRYFFKQYSLIDPVVNYARTALNHFDWGDVPRDDSLLKDFFSDAERHKVGSNGLSVPVRNRKNSHSIVSFSSEMPNSDWEAFKTINIGKLHLLSALIDSAAMADVKFERKFADAPDVNLSMREEECLLWAARGKTYEEIGEITKLSYHSVRSHLDVARHKLRGSNLTGAVAIALAMGIFPARAVIPPQLPRQTV
jgi:LuxR family transcriptional regulator, quorum-sensing system regulator CinR